MALRAAVRRTMSGRSSNVCRMSVAPRLKKSFRIGIVRGSTGEFKPVANIGLARDGGVMVMPVDVRGYSWKYGRVTVSEPEPGAHVETESRPKLHYHRSGYVSVSLSGDALPLRAARYMPIHKAKSAQILSIVAVRPWEFDSVETRQGDISTIEQRWPHRVSWTVSLIRPPAGKEHGANLLLGGATGMLGGDERRFVVDASAHDVSALLVGMVSPSHDVEDDDVEPGITVAAIPWNPRRSRESATALALWTSSMPRPIVHMNTPDELLSPADVAMIRIQVPRLMHTSEKAQQIRDTERLPPIPLINASEAFIPEWP